MRTTIISLVMMALISLGINAQTIGSMVQNNVALCSGSEDAGGDATQPNGETVSLRIVDIDGKIYAKTTTTMASMPAGYAGQIRQLMENGGHNDCWLEGYDSYATTHWTNDGLTYDDQDSDGNVSLFLMYVLPDWAAFYFTAPFNYTLGQIQKEDPEDTQAPTLYSIYVDGNDLVFDCDDQNAFFYFTDNTGKIRGSFENRYDMSSLSGVTSITAYAMDFSGNVSAVQAITFDLSIGSMKIDNKQVYGTDGEFANSASPISDVTLSTRVVDVNGIVFAKTTATGGSFDGNAYGCQLRNNAGNGEIRQLWLSNGNEDQNIRWNKPGDEWEGSPMDFSIGTLMYPDENTTELYTLCLINGVSGACATQTVEYVVGQANGADPSDLTAPVISGINHTSLEDTKLVTVSATDNDEIFYLIDKGTDGFVVSFTPEFEVSSTTTMIQVTAYDYSGNKSEAVEYDFTDTAIPENIMLTATTISVEGGVLIKSENEGNVKVYNMLGRLVYNNEISKGETFIPLEKGFYIINSTKLLVK